MGADDHTILNPHFDSMEGLEEEYDTGLDCVLIMSCGPFNLDVGEEVFFTRLSFVALLKLLFLSGLDI